MKRLLGLIALAMLALPAVSHASIDWYVYVSSDPSDGRNTQKVDISTSATTIPMISATAACGIGPIKSSSIQPYFTFESRMLGCDLPDGSEVAIQATCTNEADYSTISYMYLYNNKHMYELSVQCLNTKPKEK